MITNNRDTMQKIWLASKSPRRAELLAGMGVPFEVLSFIDHVGAQYEVDESVLPGESPRDYVRRIALDKALHAHAYLKERGLAMRPCWRRIPPWPSGRGFSVSRPMRLKRATCSQTCRAPRMRC